MMRTQNGPSAALTAWGPADTPLEGIDMQQPTTDHYAALNAQLRALCDEYHYATVRAELEAICLQVFGAPSKT
jgi:hypothetical protein